ncbi:YkvA family protein [uncultured Helcococcus sp.]|uniref:YkvA family protein n=1 Tax=uncultured Helcococcus sp. TaxID=1072508 RepID=UPI00288B8E9A|nr:YkvA family protein [uncultured Helcococcus sp.]
MSSKSRKNLVYFKLYFLGDTSKLIFNTRKAKKIYENFKRDSKKVIDDQNKTDENISEAYDKANRLVSDKSTFSTIYEDFKLLLELIQAYIKREYTVIPKGFIISAMAAVIYFLSPLDLIADFIPFIGYTDDVYIISNVLKKLHEELQNFKAWKNIKNS